MALLAIACDGDGTSTAPTSTRVTGVETPAPAAGDASVPRFEESLCSRTFPEAPQPENLRCGYLTVPEDRTSDDGRTIKLAVAVLPATGASPAPDPVVHLSGGPGGPGVEGTLGWWAESAAPIRSSRDLVFFDQRGTGRSRPGLYCPEMAEYLAANMAEAMAPKEGAARSAAAAAECRDRLERIGVNLGAYNSSASAADIQDLIRTLGYEEWNVYGISYGTRLALTTMRDRPEGLRSVILDSVLPPQANVAADMPASFERSLDSVFEACAADAACNAAFPDLMPVSLDLVARLNSSPVTVDVADPTSGTTREVQITGDLLMVGTRWVLYRTGMYPVIPSALYALSVGEYELLAATAGEFLFDAQARAAGMALSVNCSEEVSFNTAGAIASAAQGVRPQIVDALSPDPEGVLAECKAWGLDEPAAKENEPVASDIPTLVLSGEWDPVTPPSYGRLAAETLARSYVFEFPATGHGVLGSRTPCAMPIVVGFLNDPETSPDGSCASQIGPPEFIVP